MEVSLVICIGAVERSGINQSLEQPVKRHLLQTLASGLSKRQCSGGRQGLAKISWPMLVAQWTHNTGKCSKRGNNCTRRFWLESDFLYFQIVQQFVEPTFRK